MNAKDAIFPHSGTIELRECIETSTVGNKFNPLGYLRYLAVSKAGYHD